MSGCVQYGGDTVLNCAGNELTLEHGAIVMGVLNVTPDSFSDGGRYTTVSAALDRAAEMIAEGADIIDVGGASSRPAGTVYGKGAELVPEKEELARVMPVIEAVRDRFPATVVSVDSWRPSVARAALQAGAGMVNDISGLRQSAETAELAAAYGASLVVMHAVGAPGSMAHVSKGGLGMERIRAFLSRSVAVAREAGVRDVIVDPGIGFGKSQKDNLALIGRLDVFADLGCPVMVGISRKSIIGSILGVTGAPVPVHKRLYGTLGATAVAVLGGAILVRTHDVRPTVDMLRVIHAIRQVVGLEGAFS